MNSQKQIVSVHAAQAQKIDLLHPVLLNSAQNAKQAMALMIAQSGATHEALGNAIGKPRETITRFANGNAGLTPDKLEALIRECGNAYFLQYLANRIGYELVPIDTKAKRRAELLAELEELEVIEPQRQLTHQQAA